MKIGFVTRYDPLDRRTWSGTNYFLLRQVGKFGEVECFYYPLPKLLQEWLTIQKSINRRWFGKQTSVEFLRSYSRYFSRQLTRDLRRRPVDLLFVSASSQVVAYAETDIPIIYSTDATFRQLQGYYPVFSQLPAYNVRQGIRLDRRAFKKAAHCMMASEWSRRSAIEDYGTDPARISVAYFGANLDKVPAREELPWERPCACRILFFGVEWERKGGDIAWECFRILRQQGVAATLHIIGCVPPAALAAEEGVTVIPFLDKNDPRDAGLLHSILLQTDFLLLPTRAECAGIVFSEAAAYGIPALAPNTGGVSEYVRNGINGYLLSPEAGPAEYAAKIERLMIDRDEFRAMKFRARDLFEMELSWETWGRRFGAIAHQCLQDANLSS